MTIIRVNDQEFANAYEYAMYTLTERGPQTRSDMRARMMQVGYSETRYLKALRVLKAAGLVTSATFKHPMFPAEEYFAALVPFNIHLINKYLEPALQDSRRAQNEARKARYQEAVRKANFARTMQGV